MKSSTVRTRVPALALALSLCIPLHAQDPPRGETLPQELERELEQRRVQQELEYQRMLQDLEAQRARQEREMEQRRVEQELEYQRMLQDLEAQRMRQEQGLEQRRIEQELERERVLQELELAQRETRRDLGGEDWETRVFQLEHVNPTSLRRALELFRAEVDSVDELDVLSVSAPGEIMTAIEEVIRRLDVPTEQRSVEVTAHILRAGDEVTTAALPAALIEVVEQLNTIFSYTSYELVDTLLLRGAADEGEIRASGTSSLAAEGVGLVNQPTFYNFSAEPTVEEPDGGAPRIRLNQLRFGFRIPVASGQFTPQPAGGEAFRPVTQFQYIDNGINTDLEIRPGQQVVVGKTAIGENALIVVISAEILD